MDAVVGEEVFGAVELDERVGVGGEGVGVEVRDHLRRQQHAGLERVGDGGAVRVDSVPMLGTRVTFVLPSCAGPVP